MSKFYSNYRKEHTTWNDSPTIVNEERNREVHKMHIMQANMITRGKHTGSKSLKKLLFNAHRATSVINHLYSGYNA